MSHWTQFVGLAAPDAGESTQVLGGDFIYRNPDIIDALLKIGAYSHHHDAHAAVTPPTYTLTGSAGTSGTLPGNTTYYLTYTITDAYGGETTPPTTPLTITLSDSVANPTVAPVGTLVTTAGVKPSGNYAYAVTYTDGSGGETTIGPSEWVYIPPGYSSAEVSFAGLYAPMIAAAGSTWRMYTSYEGGDWWFLYEGTGDTFVDTGSVAVDSTVEPPDVNDTGSNGSISVTLPTAITEPAVGSAAYINLYLSTDPSFLSPSLYATYAASYAGTVQTVTTLTTSAGDPPEVSRSLPGAQQINPDTDILNWTWKRPVATVGALPTGGNTDGDTRVVLSTHIPYIWSAAGSSWNAISGGGGSGITVVDSLSDTVSGASTIKFQSSGSASVTVASGGGSTAVVTVTAVGSGGGGGGSVTTVTDGTHTVTGPSTIRFSGATVSLSSGQALVTVPTSSGGGGGGTSTPPSRAWCSGGASLTANVYAKVPLDTISFDTGGNMDVTTNNRYNVPVTGIYHVDYVATLAYSGTQTCTVALYKNGTLIDAVFNKIANTQTLGRGDLFQLSAGDYLEVWAECTGAAGVYNGISWNGNSLSVSRVS